MRYIAEFHLKSQREQISAPKGFWKTILFGFGSVLLYTLLFRYQVTLTEFAQRAHQGDRVLFLIPVAIAFVFSYVHGAFTGHFWDVLGFKPRIQRAG